MGHSLKIPTKTGTKFFVHRYKWSHDSRRKKARKLNKEGKIKIIESTVDGWLYLVLPTNKD